MKKVFLFVLSMMLLEGGLTSCNGQQKQTQTERSESLALEDSVAIPDSLNGAVEDPAKKKDMEAVKAFVEQFYQGWSMDDLLEYDYPKKYITPKLLQFLADSYEFDCEGECLATWKFFYEGGGDVAEMKSRKITACDASHVLVENKYANYEYTVLLTVIKDGDTFKIDSLQQKKSEYIDGN